MKLTEAKLKQMILEALKSSKFQDFGLLTPDEKLKADLGDETYGKIQSLDKDQADIMKQSFDPDYPRDIKQESINDVLEPLGLKEFYPGEFGNRDNVSKVFRTGDSSSLVPYGAIRYEATLDFGYGKYYTKSFEEYKENPYSIRYVLEIKKLTPRGRPTFNIDEEILLQRTEQIRMPKLFTIDMTDEQDREIAESLIVKKEKAAILKALEELT